MNNVRWRLGEIRHEMPAPFAEGDLLRVKWNEYLRGLKEEADAGWPPH
jgi:hypothetical protein